MNAPTPLPKTARTRLANGKADHLDPHIDPRGLHARRWREHFRSIAVALGRQPHELDLASAARCRRLAGLLVQLERAESRIAAGKDVAIDHYVAATRCAERLLQALGLGMSLNQADDPSVPVARSPFAADDAEAGLGAEPLAGYVTAAGQRERLRWQGVTPEQALARLTGVRRARGEAEQSYLKRLHATASNLEPEGWESLPAAARAWLADCDDAVVNEQKTLPPIPRGQTNGST